MRVCIACGRELPLGMFDDNWRHKVNRCRDCVKKQKKKYRHDRANNNKSFEGEHLSKFDIEVFYFIVQYKVENGGISPTIGEIEKGTEISEYRVSRILNKLSYGGFIDTGEDSQHRNIRITGDHYAVDRRRKRPSIGEEIKAGNA